MGKFDNVKPGEKVWCIEEDDYASYLFMATCKNYVIVCPTYLDHKGEFDDQLAEMCKESEDECGVDVNIFRDDKVFLTEEDAQKYCN